jgi:hypothetical protein
METVLFFLLLGFGAWITVRNFPNLIRGDDLSILPRAEVEFRTLVVNSDIPALCFDGRTAEIVDERQEGMTQNDVYTLVSVQRFARNAHGEYFLFISEGSGRPFFKHVSQTNAKIALGRKYVAPTP